MPLLTAAQFLAAGVEFRGEDSPLGPEGADSVLADLRSAIDRRKDLIRQKSHSQWGCEVCGDQWHGRCPLCVIAAARLRDELRAAWASLGPPPATRQRRKRKKQVPAAPEPIAVVPEFKDQAHEIMFAANLIGSRLISLHIDGMVVTSSNLLNVPFGLSTSEEYCTKCDDFQSFILGVTKAQCRKCGNAVGPRLLSNRARSLLSYADIGEESAKGVYKRVAIFCPCGSNMGRYLEPTGGKLECMTCGQRQRRCEFCGNRRLDDDNPKDYCGSHVGAWQMRLE